MVLGREISEHRDYIDTVAETIDVEVLGLIQHAYDIAKNVIDTNMGKLSALASHLVEHETIEGDELKELLDQAPAVSVN